MVNAVPVYDRLFVEGLKDDAVYKIESRSYILNRKDFGRHVTPSSDSQKDRNKDLEKILVEEDGFKSYIQKYTASGIALKEGIFLDPLYLGTGYEKHIRIPLDYGSDIYLIKEK